MTAVEKAESRDALASLLEENREGLLTCVHCGLCLPSCPTYRELGNENDSPRGRIYLMRALIEGRLPASDSFTNHIDLCLGCRACETVCPSGVPYGHLLEAARAKAAEIEVARGSVVARLTAFVLDYVFTRPALLRIAFTLSRWLRDSGLAQLAFESEAVTGRLRFALALLLSSRPPSLDSLTKTRDGANPPAIASERSGPKVAVLRGCVMEGMFAQTNRATERVLSRNSCRVIDAKDQSCCGALHAHAGQVQTAKTLARRNIDAFTVAGVDRIIVNAAGCGAAMKEYGHLLKDDPEYAQKAIEFSSKVRDVSEFLCEVGVKPPDRAVQLKVAYDAACHVIHAQRIVEQPMRVLRSIPGLKLVPLQGYETCCGGAGIYNLLNPQLSGEILSKKVENIRKSGASLVVTSNPGCMMQIGAGLLMDETGIGVVQLVDLLDAAYSEEGSLAS